MKSTRVDDTKVESGQAQDLEPEKAGAFPAPGVPFQASCQKSVWGRAEALQRLGGDEELFGELCQIFLQESPKILNELRRAIAAADSNTVMRAAHSLKGELSYLSAGAAVQAAQDLEDMGQQGNLSRSAKTLAVLEQQIKDLYVVIRESAEVLG
jgi:HPt (histidine-containing phosphotransfer) domain-containing protein